MTERLASVDGRRWALMSRLDIKDTDNGNPDAIYLTRWRIISTPLFAIYLHAIRSDDGDRPLHDHPWPFIRIILWGTYVEERPGGTLQRMRQGRWSYMPATGYHSIRGLGRSPTWTLCLVGPRVRDWGYATPEGWVSHKAYELSAGGARASSPAESPGAPVSGTTGAPSDEAVRRAYERVVAEVGEEALFRYLDAVRDDEDSVTPEELGYPDWYVDPEDDNKSSTGGAPEGESVGARIKREGEEARHVLLAQMAAEAVAADDALDGGDVGTYEVESSGGPIVVPGTSANSMRALRAMQAGVPVSLRHDTGEWTIEPRTPEEWAEWGQWEDDESSAAEAP